MSSTSNLTRDFFDDLGPEPSVDSQPFEEPRPIRGLQQALVHGSGEDSQRRNEPEAQHLAGSDSIPVVRGDDGRVPYLQSEHESFGLPETKPEILKQPGEDLLLLDLLHGEPAFLNPLPDEQAIGAARPFCALRSNGSWNEGSALEVVQEDVEQLRLCQQDQSRSIEDQHAGQCTTNVRQRQGEGLLPRE